MRESKDSDGDGDGDGEGCRSGISSGGGKVHVVQYIAPLSRGSSCQCQCQSVSQSVSQSCVVCPVCSFALFLAAAADRSSCAGHLLFGSLVPRSLDSWLLASGSSWLLLAPPGSSLFLASSNQVSSTVSKVLPYSAASNLSGTLLPPCTPPR